MTYQGQHYRLDDPNLRTVSTAHVESMVREYIARLGYTMILADGATCRKYRVPPVGRVFAIQQVNPLDPKGREIVIRKVGLIRDLAIEFGLLDASVIVEA